MTQGTSRRLKTYADLNLNLIFSVYFETYQLISSVNFSQFYDSNGILYKKKVEKKARKLGEYLNDKFTHSNYFCIRIDRIALHFR